MEGTIATKSGVENGGINANDNKQQSTGQESPKTYTQEQMQSEVDKRMKQYLENHKEEFAQTIKKEREDAAKKAKMSAEELARTEASERDKSFAAERKQFESEKALFDATKQILKNGMPASFANFVVGATPEETASNITNLKAEFDKSIENGVNEKLKGKTPKSSNSEIDVFEAAFKGGRK